MIDQQEAKAIYAAGKNTVVEALCGLHTRIDELELNIHVCHFPPGTSKWNKIEHKMFSFVSKNWRGRPLDSLATIVNLIANTTTKSGLHIETSIDKNIYEKSIKVSDEEMKSLNITSEKFQGQWNYRIIHQA